MSKKPNQSSKGDAQGDKISVGQINQSTGVAIGRGAQSNVTQNAGASADDLAKAFAAIIAGRGAER